MDITQLVVIILVSLILYKLRVFETKGIKVAESPEVTAFRESVSASLDNLSADVVYLVDKVNQLPGLSEEDKAALNSIAERTAALAAVFEKPVEG